MVSWENIVFDPTFYGLSAFLVSLLVYALAAGVRSWRAQDRNSKGGTGLGIGMVALGTMISMIGSVSLIILLRSSLVNGILYQQVQFTIGYIGTATILFGLHKIWSLKRPPTTLLTWIVFLIATGISSAYLFNPSSYSISVSGGTQHVAQETIFWLPVFATIAIGLTGVLAKRERAGDVSGLRLDLWLALFLISVLVGIVKESNIAPSTGDPFIDLLAAFVPFTLAGIFLAVGARSITSARSAPSEVEVPTPVRL